jgi:uncharacterized membrane protein YfcA
MGHVTPNEFAVSCCVGFAAGFIIFWLLGFGPQHLIGVPLILVSLYFLLRPSRPAKMGWRERLDRKLYPQDYAP